LPSPASSARSRSRERELPGAGPEVHDRGVSVQALRSESVQVLGRIRVPLLPVEAGHEGRVEVFGSRVRQFVDHP